MCSSETVRCPGAGLTLAGLNTAAGQGKIEGAALIQVVMGGTMEETGETGKTMEEIGEMGRTMEEIGEMVITMEEIGAMEILTTSREDVLITMEGKGEVQNKPREEAVVVAEHLDKIMEAGTMEDKDSTRDTTTIMDDASVTASALDLKSAAIFTTVINVHNPSIMDKRKN